MASKSSDAEQLLNTIVAARVRLSSLRGGQELNSGVATKPLDLPAHEPVNDEPLFSSHQTKSAPVQTEQHEVLPEKAVAEQTFNEPPSNEPLKEQSFVLGIAPVETEADPLFDAFDVGEL